jgi:hypothetical protein
MADVASFDGISADPLSYDQIQAIINQIDLNIYNLMLEGKNATLYYQQNGPAGKMADHARALEALMLAKKQYQVMLDQIPYEVHSQFDDPAF